jgi:peptidoglycan L-alanyl-D-glutamate endopeptidase CwlK
MTRVFGTKSKGLLEQAHPLLGKIMTRALEIGPEDFSINESYRGKADQEAAVARGTSKVHYPNSAHNQTDDGRPCSCAVDVLPYPFKGWEAPESRASWGRIADAVFKAADEIGVKVRWGGGRPDHDFNWDLPHFELHPWREHVAGK